MKTRCWSCGICCPARALFQRRQALSSGNIPSVMSSPPAGFDAQDLAKCADFGRQIAFWLQNSTVGDFSLKVPGHYPYRARGAQSGIAHQISSDCIFCLHCAEVCPTGAISSKSPAIQDVSLCIKCQACAKKCPKSARIVPGGFLETMVEKLSAMCGDSRKEPEFFLVDESDCPFYVPGKLFSPVYCQSPACRF